LVYIHINDLGHGRKICKEKIFEKQNRRKQKEDNHAVMARDFVLVGGVKPIPVNAKVFFLIFI
jgi:hypothetical protein